MELPNFVNSYDISDTFYGVKVLKFPSKFKREYELFLQGKYSEFSNTAKALITKYHINNSQLKFAAHAVNKHEALRRFWENELQSSINSSQEYWSAPVEEKEVLTAVIKNAMTFKVKLPD